MSKIKQAVMYSVAATGTLAMTSAHATDGNWHFEGTLYWLAYSLSGDVGVGPINADVDIGFEEVLEDLEFGAMTRLRVADDQWAFAAEIFYVGLGTAQNGVHVELDHWAVEPTIGYRLAPSVELIAGARYTNIGGEIRDPGAPAAPVRTHTQEWWHPIVGANVQLPLTPETRFDFRADIGGFDEGSEFTWQIFPAVTWLLGEHAAFQAGYRWLYVDHVDGSGPSQFRYDMLAEGAQVGLSMHF